jgi:thioesterase domain-containing protein
LDGRITLFQAEETRKVWGDSWGSWKGFALEGVELLETPGDHFTMVRAPHVKSLAESLARRIESVTALN